MSPSARQVQLSHGEGGRQARQLVCDILDWLGDASESQLDDAARLPMPAGNLAMTTDSYVVSPRFFPGGNIGSLAIHGTVNDLSVNGATPSHIALSLIIEEGFDLDELRKIIKSVADAARQSSVLIVAGDTKVTPRGAVDGLFINTTGVGVLRADAPAGPQSFELGDVLVVSGPIGSHGMAVMSVREKLGFNPPPRSDSAPLNEVAGRLLDRLGNHVRAMRDATRGGVAAVLHEWAEASGRQLAIDEAQLPVSPEVRGACELLGVDPLHVANEGAMVVAVDADAAELAVTTLRESHVSAQASQFGVVRERVGSPVIRKGALGVERPIDDPQGAPLPRIC